MRLVEKTFGSLSTRRLVVLGDFGDFPLQRHLMLDCQSVGSRRLKTSPRQLRQGTV
jgi:hypothetical protein